MSLRQRLLAALSLIIIMTVAVIGYVVTLRTKEAFEAADTARTEALVQQFRQEFQRSGDQVARRIETVAQSDALARMALDLGQGGDPAAYLNDAANLAQAHRLDFLEFSRTDGSIISSAQWPARFGYKEAIPTTQSSGAFLQRVELPDGTAIGLLAVRPVTTGAQPLYVIGGERLDRDFLASISLPVGMRAFLYRCPDNDSSFNPQNLIGPNASPDTSKLAAIVQAAQEHGGQEVRGIVHWTDDLADSESFHAIPLKAQDGKLIAVLLVGSSRQTLVELVHHIRAIALTVGGFGILAAILLSLWLAARVTRPVEDLAIAAGAVAAGNWDTHVAVKGSDELAQLADAFNKMTHEIIDQRERLVQSERVAAWRELARRLAHELKNPLFPLQITVENLLRARHLPEAEFDEIFKESTATLLAEIANLKTIIGRFSDFSKMPQPQLQRVQINDLLKRVVSVYEPQFKGREKPITDKLELGDLPEIDADPDLLHRVFSNLVLNAMDAMPDGGTLTVRTRALDSTVQIDISDTGTGITQEESKRLFTPYYTSKQHGTGLGLAIVQSVISDHRGSIAVESEPGTGATFRIELPKRLESALKAEPAQVG